MLRTVVLFLPDSYQLMIRISYQLLPSSPIQKVNEFDYNLAVYRAVNQSRCISTRTLLSINLHHIRNSDNIVHYHPQMHTVKIMRPSCPQLAETESTPSHTILLRSTFELVSEPLLLACGRSLSRLPAASPLNMIECIFGGGCAMAAVDISDSRITPVRVRR